MAYKDKEDARRWYAENREASIASALRTRPTYIKRNQDFVDAVKAAGECADCGLKPEVLSVLEFDHIGDDKEMNISALVRRPASIAKIQKEIDKCELVCANCHRVRTHNRRVGSGFSGLVSKTD